MSAYSDYKLGVGSPRVLGGAEKSPFDYSGVCYCPGSDCVCGVHMLGLSIDNDTIPQAATVNPKELAGARKPATWSVMPRWVSLLVGRVMSVGAAKYGAFNYRQSRIAASTYQDAMERHASLWFDGEDNDPETGVSHLASIIASCSLLLDAQVSGKLDDDRQKTGRVREWLDALEGLLVTLPLPAKHTA